MPKVSIIVPAYNAELYLRECADSILKQTLEDIEIIFIDDGSTDNTGKIIDELKLCFPNKNIQIVHQENKGLYKTREIGLSLATGDYIGWVDADDFIEKDMYEILYNYAIDSHSELVFCDYSWYPEKIRTKEKWFRKYTGKIDTAFVERNSQPWNKIVKKELLERLNIGAYFVTCFDEIYIRVLMEAKNPITIDQNLYHYRVSSGTMSSSYQNIDHYKRFITASEELRKLMNTIVDNDYWKEYFEYRVIYYYLMTMIVSANCGNRDEYSALKKQLRELYPKYKRNQHYLKILTYNYGYIKARVIGYLIPTGYLLAYNLCKIGLK